MELKEVKYNLNRQVIYNAPRLHIEAVPYILKSCIIRKNDRGEFFYQAEIQDIKAPHSVCIVPLDDLMEVSQ